MGIDLRNPERGAKAVLDAHHRAECQAVLAAEGHRNMSTQAARNLLAHSVQYLFNRADVSSLDG